MVLSFFFVIAIIIHAESKNVYRNEFVDMNGDIISSRLEANEPNLCDPRVQAYSGYFSADLDNEYFYWFFESRTSPQNSPLIMWLSGGPGCSSIAALLTENGPCSVNSHATDTELNPYSWNQNANIMFVDQPPGTGFSTGPKIRTEAEIAKDMFAFLQNFISHFSQYFSNGFYVFGESFAGHYVPNIVNYIYQQKVNNIGTPIPLVGFAIGNGITYPYVQFEWYALMAYNSTTARHVIDFETYNTMTAHIPECQSLILKCNEDTSNRQNCETANDFCQDQEIAPVEATGANRYNLNLQCEIEPLCYNFSNVDVWMNNETVQHALGVDMQWDQCTDYEQLDADWMIDYELLLSPLLDNKIRGLIYNGDLDFVCNYLGGRAWAKDLDWSGKKGFNNAVPYEWNDSEGNPAGMLRQYQTLTFLQVYKAGHMAPMDQPLATQTMVNQFVNDTLK